MLFNLQFARHCMCTTVTRAITLMQFPNCITTYGQLTEIHGGKNHHVGLYMYGYRKSLVLPRNISKNNSSININIH